MKDYDVLVCGDGTRVVDGIPQELVERMVSLKGCIGHIRGAILEVSE